MSSSNFPLTVPYSSLKEQVAKLSKENSNLKDAGHKWPPIINLSEADGYFFKVARAEVSPKFEKQLSESVTPHLLSLIEKYNVDTVEVIGHTDEQPMHQRPSNLDETLAGVLNDKGEIIDLEPADNAGLGIARAAAVVKLLRSDNRLSGLRILPYTGAQLIQTDETLTLGNKTINERERRRIEIRVRRSNSSNR